MLSSTTQTNNLQAFIVGGSMMRRIAPLFGAAASATFSSPSPSSRGATVSTLIYQRRMHATTSTFGNVSDLPHNHRTAINKVPFTDLRRSAQKSSLKGSFAQSPEIATALPEMRELSVVELEQWIQRDDGVASGMTTGDLCCVAGDMLRNGHDFRRAAVLYERALHFQPANVTTLHSYATMLEDDLGDIQRAIDLYKKANHANPSDVRSCLRMANLYADKLRNYKEAARLFKRVAVLKPFHPSAMKSALVAEALVKAQTKNDK